MAGFEMPQEEDVNKPDANDDPISRAISETLGETNEQNTGAEGGDEGKKPEDGKQQSEAGADRSGGDKNDNKQQAPDGKGKKDEKQASPANGDLTLPDGSVVKAGAERRHYEGRRLAEQQLSMRTNELKQANDSKQRVVDELNTLKSSVQSLHGAEPAQIATGLKIVRDLTRDPVGTLKSLLTEAVAAGYTIEGIAQGIDVNSIRQSFEAKLQPLLEQNQQQEQQQKITQDIEAEVTQFFGTHPDAVIHDALIAQVMQKNPSLDIRDAYYQLKMAANDRGLDWTQPLVPQMQASEQQQQNNQQQQQQKPMPNGRTPANAAQAEPADKIAVAHESTDMGSIVKQAMRESGLSI